MPVRIPPFILRSAFIVALTVIFVLAMIPLPAALTVFSFQDKLEHGGAFAVLMLMGWAGWPTRCVAVATGLIGYGILIEVCQHALTTNRVGDPWDVLADALGVGIGLALVRRLAG